MWWQKWTRAGVQRQHPVHRGVPGVLVGGLAGGQPDSGRCPKRILMHSFAYSIESSMATMIAEFVCVISLSDEPNADYGTTPLTLGNLNE